MNCKPGDLAVIVRSEAGNEGKIVEVVCLDTDGVGAKFNHWGLCAHWIVKTTGAPIISTIGVARNVTSLPDSYLRPIRDNDGEDETLTWAGKPSHIEVTQ